jgi:hypothetical protein
MKYEMAELDEKIFEMTKKIVTGLVVASFVIAGSQTAAYSLFSGQRSRVEVRVWQVGKQAGIPHLPPSQNAGEVAKRLGYGRAGVYWGIPVGAGA